MCTCICLIVIYNNSSIEEDNVYALHCVPYIEPTCMTIINLNSTINITIIILQLES